MKKRFLTLYHKIREKHFLLTLIGCFLLLLMSFLLLVNLFYMQLNQIGKTDAIEQCSRRFQKNASEIEKMIQDAYTRGITLLQNHTVSSTIKDYDRLSTQDRLQLPNVLSLLSDLTMLDDAVLHAYLYIDDKKVYTEDGIYDRDLYFQEFHQYSESGQNPQDTVSVSAENMVLLPPVSLTAGGRQSTVLPMVITRLSNQMVLV